jgi:hypothetical protein
MFELLLLLAVLLPVLILAAIIGIFVRARNTSRHFRVHDSDISEIRSELHRVSAHLESVESRVRELLSAMGSVPRVSGDIEMGAPPKRAAKPAPKPREKRTEAPVKPVILYEPQPEPAPLPKPASAPLPRTREIDLGGLQPAEGSPKVRLTPPKPSRGQQLATKLLANWTGILGTVVLVSGIGFLGTYAAIRMEPFARFVLVVAAAAALFAGYLSLRHRERWIAMSLWLRSSAAAVFLFACAAAGGLPNIGLMWIESAPVALGVLLVGVAFNLALAWSVGKEGFATLHVVLSLIPMAILPQATMTLGIVTAIALFGVLLAQRQQWAYHLAASMLLYAIYHVFWITSQGLSLPLSGSLPGIVAGSAAVIYFSSALTNYRKSFAERQPTSVEFVTHLASWGALAVAFVFHLHGTTLMGAGALGPVLLASGLVALTLSINAKRRQIHWLRDTEVIIAQGFILGSLVTWQQSLEPTLLFAGVIFLENLLFLRLVINDGARPAVLVGTVASAGAAILFMLAGVLTLTETTTAIGHWPLAAAMAAGAAVTGVAGNYLVRNHREPIERLIGLAPMQVTGVIAGLMVVVAMISLYEQLAAGVAGFAMAAGLYLASRRMREIGLDIGTWIAIITTQIVAWLVSFDNYSGMPAQQLAQLAPAAFLAVLVIRQAPPGASAVIQRQAAIALLGVNLGVSAYLLMNPVSALMPTVAWVLLSLAALETANRLSSKAFAVTVLNLGYAYVVAAAIGYVTVVLPTLTYVATINLRMVMELFGIGALLYWWLSRPSEPLAAMPSWRMIHPYFLEVTIALVATTVFIEVPLVWRPLAWMTFALLFLATPLTETASRFYFYSLLAYVTSILAVAINVSTAEVPTGIWYEQPWNTGLVAIGVQFAYLFVANQRLHLQTVSFQPGLQILQRVSSELSRNRSATICYPFFAGLALFLAWRFESTLLTFLWTLEVFAIFILSIVFAQNHFRLVALGGMAACLLRLVVYDMQEADLLIRGLVFVGVGGLMLAMNAVYNKYGTRVSS